jgi:hypothetical protein
VLSSPEVVQQMIYDLEKVDNGTTSASGLYGKTETEEDESFDKECKYAFDYPPRLFCLRRSICSKQLHVWSLWQIL